MSEPVWSDALVLGGVFLFAWWHQQRSKNAGWVDVVWAGCTALLGLWLALSGSGEPALRLLVAGLYGLGFGRLTIHLARRVRHDPEEDGRYAAMRAWAGHRQAWVFGVFYGAQALFVLIFTWPARVLAEGLLPPTWALILGLGLWLTGQWGVYMADRQLDQFRRRPENRGKTCREGVWCYSRHPNYFFEWLHSWAWPLLALNTTGGEWLWLYPAIVFVFLYWMTGIPHTERQALRSRGEDYRDYQRTTSPFIPWRPKS